MDTATLTGYEKEREKENGGESRSFSSEQDDESEEAEDDEFMYGAGTFTERKIEHYSSLHRMLLVGEGDFSFSLSLARAFTSARNMVATSLDTRQDIINKYSNGIWNVRELEELGCVVLCGVDATKMSEHFFLRTQRFDRIVYNFPHVGFIFPEATACQIKLNKGLVKGFLKNAKVLLRKDHKGEIHVTHKDGYPYEKWDLVKKAEKLGLALLESVPFCKDKYPGYDNKRAHGSLSDAPFRLGDCTTFKFRLVS
ncbi:heavy metal-associated isoprenylated plant protein 41-like [Diospyros lotus]|uniref:heavy metal-associated isoprenylated plant protein 41-like n=1 Tax=Diospyros lotus TaxID=55363 RepID=UPI00225A31D7|nr:heavy metal-associated isoprenylated plant protein 41-like [Diospyros lotus]